MSNWKKERGKLIMLKIVNSKEYKMYKDGYNARAITIENLKSELKEEKIQKSVVETNLANLKIDHKKEIEKIQKEHKAEINDLKEAQDAALAAEVEAHNETKKALSEVRHSNGGLKTSNERMKKQIENDEELINNMKTQIDLLNKEKEEQTLTITNLTAETEALKEALRQHKEKLESYEKRPTIEELKTEKMSKVDRSKIVGSKKRRKK